VSNASGKLVILAIVAVALAAAGTSWWFRYRATSQAAQFWGTHRVRLIRDASIVELCAVSELPDKEEWVRLKRTDQLKQIDRRAKDITGARGLTHLRNALLEDRSFDWEGPESRVPERWGYILIFREQRTARASTYVMFSEDATMVTGSHPPTWRVLSCKPIAAGLREMFAELFREDAETSR
jgi:hypothetical protein